MVKYDKSTARKGARYVEDRRSSTGKKTEKERIKENRKKALMVASNPVTAIAKKAWQDVNTLEQKTRRPTSIRGGKGGVAAMRDSSFDSLAGKPKKPKKRAARRKGSKLAPAQTMTRSSGSRKKGRRRGTQK